MPPRNTNSTSESNPHNVVAAAKATMATIAVKAIEWPDQPRHEFDNVALDELAASMAERGLLSPIGVTQHGDVYRGVFGERRLRAAKHLGWDTIPAIILPEAMIGNPSDRLECALIENAVRVDLKPVEMAKAFSGLMTARGWTAKELARRVGRSEAAISQAVALLKLEPSVQADVDDGRVPATTAYEISKKPAAQHRELAQRVQSEQLTRTDIKRNRPPKSAPKASPKAVSRSSKSLPSSSPTLTLGDGITVSGTTITVNGPPMTTLDDVRAALEKLRLAVENAASNTPRTSPETPAKAGS